MASERTASPVTTSPETAKAGETAPVTATANDTHPAGGGEGTDRQERTERKERAQERAREEKDHPSLSLKNAGAATDNKEMGKRGEQAAAAYLERLGYEILERNWQCRFGEADIIARDEDAVVFVEVKTRTGVECGLPEEAVTPVKRRKYEQIAAAYLQHHDYRNMPVRFDIIGILVVDATKEHGRALLRHHKSAFGADC